jgi:hypothetical protein
MSFSRSLLLRLFLDLGLSVLSCIFLLSVSCCFHPSMRALQALFTKSAYLPEINFDYTGYTSERIVVRKTLLVL